MKENYSVILFDGICNFCSSSVNFIIARDTKNRFRFAALQSDFGKRFLKQSGLNTQNLKTIILIEHGKFYTKTGAALRIAKYLKGFWKFFYVFIIIPPFIRNIVYYVIAKYRFTWFGKRDKCRVPSQEEKDKFLD
jgi:predicted DCC family thiol-disulfide oxidoreductase YuxK